MTYLLKFTVSLISYYFHLALENFVYMENKMNELFCDWWISIRFVCFCVSRSVACDRNYGWRKQKTQLWRRLLNFRVRMFVKSAVIRFFLFFLFFYFICFMLLCSKVSAISCVGSKYSCILCQDLWDLA